MCCPPTSIRRAYHLEFPYLSTHSNPVPVRNPLKLLPQPIGSTMLRVLLLDFDQVNVNVVVAEPSIVMTIG